MARNIVDVCAECRHRFKLRLTSSYSSLYCFRLYDIAIYRGKYLQRRIPHAWHWSFNPYIITNKEAHIINGNITEGNIKNNKATFARQLSLETNDTHPGRYSCAVDYFRELAFAIFRDSLQHIERNEFFETLYEACLHLQNCNVDTDMSLIRELFGSIWHSVATHLLQCLHILYLVTYLH